MFLYLTQYDHGFALVLAKHRSTKSPWPMGMLSSNGVRFIPSVILSIARSYFVRKKTMPSASSVDSSCNPRSLVWLTGARLQVSTSPPATAARALSALSVRKRTKSSISITISGTGVPISKLFGTLSFAERTYIGISVSLATNQHMTPPPQNTTPCSAAQLEWWISTATVLGND